MTLLSSLKDLLRHRKARAFTFNIGDVIERAKPFKNDRSAVWDACPDVGTRMTLWLAVRAPAAPLLAAVAAAVRDEVVALPMATGALDVIDAAVSGTADPARVAELRASAGAIVDARGRLDIAAVLRAAAWVAVAAQAIEARRDLWDDDPLGAAVTEILLAAQLRGAYAATGMTWTAAMTKSDGPGWTAYHARSRELALRLEPLKEAFLAA